MRRLKRDIGDRKGTKESQNEIMTNKSIKKSRLISTKFTYQREPELNGQKGISLILGRNYTQAEAFSAVLRKKSCRSGEGEEK